MYPLLRDPRFLTLTAGHALNGIGSWAGLIAIWGYAAYQFDLGSAHLALLAAAWGVPSVVLGPIAGVVIDRLGARRVAVTADLANAVVALAMMTAVEVSWLLALVTLHGIGKAFSGPAYNTLPSRAVEPHQLFAANALFSAASDLAMVLGPVVAASVIAAAGPAAAFAVDAATYVLAAAATLPLRPRPQTPATEPGGGARADLAELLETVRDPRVSPLFLLGFSLWLSFGTFIVLEPVFVRDVLEAPVTTFALLQTTFGLGLVATGLLLPVVRDRLGTVLALSVVMALAGVAALSYAGAPSVAVAFVASALWGGTVALFSAPSRTLLMRRTPESAHGRVLGTWQAVNSLGQLVPAGVVPLVVGLGVQPVLVLASLLPLGAGVVVGLRHRPRPPEAVTTTPAPRSRNLDPCASRPPSTSPPRPTASSPSTPTSSVGPSGRPA